MEAIYDGVLNTIIDAGDFCEFSGPTSSSDGDQPEVVQGQRGIYFEGKGHTGNPDLDNCPHFEDKRHLMGNSTPENLSPGDAQTADCSGCERSIPAVRESYETCIGCDMSLCSSCFSRFYDESSNTLLPLLVTVDFPFLVIFSIITKLLLNKTYRDFLLSVYYIYKSKSQK